MIALLFNVGLDCDRMVHDVLDGVARRGSRGRRARDGFGCSGRSVTTMTKSRRLPPADVEAVRCNHIVRRDFARAAAS